MLSAKIPVADHEQMAEALREQDRRVLRKHISKGRQRRREQCQAVYNTGMKTAEKPLLERILEPVTRSLNQEAARSLLRVRANAKDQARVAELAQKCNEGTLSEAERSEYDMYVWAGKIVALLQANARIILSKNASESYS